MERLKHKVYRDNLAFFSSATGAEIQSYWNDARVVDAKDAEFYFQKEYGDNYDLEHADDILTKYGPNDEIPSGRK